MNKSQRNNKYQLTKLSETLKSEELELNEIMKSGLFAVAICTADKLSIKFPTCIASCKRPRDSRKS